MNIVELAKELNISTGTVSRALNDRAEVSPDTRRRVLEKARELGFTPNPNARRLVTGRNHLIRLECPDSGSLLADYFLIQTARSVEEAAANRGYELLLRLRAGRRNSTKADLDVVDGLVLIVSPTATAQEIESLTGNRVPATVICGAEPPPYEGAVSYVCVDTLPAVREAIELLVGQGHRRIGYVGSGLPDCRVRGAFPRLIREAGLEWEEELAADTGVAIADGHRGARRLLNLPDRPTALLARTDVLALGALQAARDLGLSVPGDLSVVGHDDIEMAALAAPALTTVAIDMERLGSVATAALLDRIEGADSPVVQTIHAHLVVRQSTGPCRVA